MSVYSDTFIILLAFHIIPVNGRKQLGRKKVMTIKHHQLPRRNRLSPDSVKRFQLAKYLQKLSVNLEILKCIHSIFIYSKDQKHLLAQIMFIQHSKMFQVRW